MAARSGLDSSQSRQSVGDRPGTSGTGGPVLVPPTAPPAPAPAPKTNVPPDLPPRPPPASGQSEAIYESPPHEQSTPGEEKDETEEFCEKFSKMDIDKQQLILNKLKMNTTQRLYPTTDVEEMHSEIDIVIEDNEEKANRVHRRMEISDTRYKDLEGLENVYKLKIAENEKEDELVEELGEIREEGSRLVKTKDTLERFRDGRISDPEDIEKRMRNLGDFKVEYAKIKRPKKTRIVKLVDANQQTGSDTEDEFFDSQESFASEVNTTSKSTKKSKNKSSNQARPPKSKKSKSKKKKEEEPSEPSSSDSSSSSSDSSGNETDSEREKDDNQDSKLSLSQFANEKLNGMLDRKLLQVKRFLKRAADNKDHSDKGTLEKVKTELASAMNLLDKATVEEKNGTSKQWREVDKYTKKVAKAQRSNLEKLKILETDSQRRAQLPKASLESWSGDSATLQDWIAHLKQTLKFEDELLNVASLKKAISESKEKKKILRRLQYCKTLDQCFERLEKFYGGFDVTVRELKAKIDLLPNHPDTKEAESQNVEELLYFIDQMRAHGMEKEVVNKMFIDEKAHKLSSDNAYEVGDSKIKTCDAFEDYLENLLGNNKWFTQTQPKQAENRKPPRIQHNATNVEENPEKKKFPCALCPRQKSTDHAIWNCPKLENKTVKVRRAMIAELGKCFGCFRKREVGHLCPSESLRFKCEEHKCNISLCKCEPRGHPTVQHNSSQVTPENPGALINGTALGNIGFFSENIEIKSPKGTKHSLHVTYDTLASHSTGDQAVLRPLTKEIQNMGVELKIRTYLGEAVEPARKCQVVINTFKGERKVEFLVSKSFMNNIKRAEYDIPEEFRNEFDLNETEAGQGGDSYLLIGMDLLDLHPEVLKQKDGLAVARSKITGRILFAGKTNKEDRPETANIDLQMNRMVIQEAGPLHLKKEETKNERKEKKENSILKKEDTGEEKETVLNLAVVEKEDVVLKALSTDAVNINPFQKCSSCKQCKVCSKLKASIPRCEEQEELTKTMEESVKFREETKRYHVEYPHNQLLEKLKTNETEALKMMQLLEKRLIKNNLTDQFNQSMKKKMEAGLYIEASKIPEAEGLQKSFITLTFTLHKRDEEGNPKLRVCSNSSFHSGDSISFNSTCLPTPAYLNLLESVLQKVKTRNHFAFADVTSCYTQMDCSLRDASLRRVWLRPGGMGSDTPWTQYLTVRVDFGDLLGGSAASTGIKHALQTGVKTELAEQTVKINIMDDIACIHDLKGILEENKKMIESALLVRNLPLKGWVTSGDDTGRVKYLSYIYDPKTDTFSPNVKFNLSPIKRGAKTESDVKSPDMVEAHVERFPWTKRRLAGLCASFMHDPSGYLAPATNSFKFFTREVTLLQTGWDNLLPAGLSARITSTVKIMMQAENLSFPRQSLFSAAAEISIDCYFDASMIGVGTVIAAKNTFEDGKCIYRFLKSKSKLNGKDIVNCPRAELVAAVVCVRLYNILLQDLSEFIKSYTGKLSFRVIGDSQIVLLQLAKPFYVFKTWVATRLLEIHEIIQASQREVQFLFCNSAENYSDCLTREFNKPPSQIPWTRDLQEPSSLRKLDPSKKPLQEFPEIDLKKVVNIQNNFRSVRKNISVPEQFVKNEGKINEVTLQDILLFAIVQQAAGREGEDEDEEEQEEPPDTLESIVDHLLDTFQSYFRIKNVLAYVLHWKIKNWELAQKKAEEKLFQAQQQECLEYLKTFKGNEFKTVMVNNVTYVRGRKTIDGITYLFLVPPHTKIYHVLADTFHKKYHRKGIYTRGILLRSGYYLPSALHKLKSLSNSCGFCRRRDQLALTTEMGALGEARLGPGPGGRPFRVCQADVWGPVKIVKDFVNQRGPTRRGYVLVIICEFSRFVILHALEGLSKQNLLDALDTVFYRYGKISKLRTDFGGNFLSVREELANTGDTVATDADLREFSSQMKSKGTEIELKAPHAPWASAGGAESMNKNIMKVMGEVKQSYTAFQFIRFLEKCQFLINERPISLSNTLEVLCPNDISSLHTKIQNVESFDEFIKKSDENVKLFTEKWMDLYMSALYSQRRWFESSKIEKGSLVLVLDTKNDFNYPSLGILRNIEKGTTDNADRYFMIEHRTRTGQTRMLRRPAQQLSLVLAKSEMGGDREASEDEDEPDGDDDDQGRGDEPEEEDAVDGDQTADPPVTGRIVRGPPITREDLLGQGGSVDMADHMEPDEDITANDNNSVDNEPVYDDIPDDTDKDEVIDNEEEKNEHVDNIDDVDTDYESQPSDKDSIGDDIEEELDSGPFTAVDDNIKTRPALKVKVSGAPKKNEKIVDQVKKPKRKGQKKRKN